MDMIDIVVIILVVIPLILVIVVIILIVVIITLKTYATIRVAAFSPLEANFRLMGLRKGVDSTDELGNKAVRHASSFSFRIYFHVDLDQRITHRVKRAPSLFFSATKNLIFRAFK